MALRVASVDENYMFPTPLEARLGTKIDTAKTAAISDATTKYGGLPAKVSMLETMSVLTRPNLGTEDLNTVTTTGIYSQAVSGNATLERNYPVGAAGRGQLTVTRVSASIVWQVYYATFLRRMFFREYTGAVWSPWGEPGVANTSTALLIRPNLGTEDLNTVKAAGIYPQATSGTATTARHYPSDAAGGRGILTVYPLSESMIAQEYNATFQQRVSYREFDGVSWAEWKEVGADVPAGPDPELIARVDAVQADIAGLNGRADSARADISVLNGEQDAQDSRLGTLESRTGLANPVKSAQVNGEGLLTFTLADSTVTAGVRVPASLPTDQVDYVEQLRRRSNYTALWLKKADSTGRIEVSAVAPSGRHVTFEFKGASTGPTDDDYRMQQRIWVGDSTGTTRNKTLLVGPSSNRDFAIQVTPTGSGLAPAFVPDHGPASAFNMEPTRYYHGGTLLDVTAMTAGQTIQLSGKFEIVQHVMGRHPDAPGTDLMEIWTTQTIHPDGVLSMDGRLRIVAPTTLGAGYFIMAPVAAPVFDTAVTSLNNRYPNNPGLVGKNTFLPEADVATSYAFLSSANRDVAVAVRYNNPSETIRRGQPNKLPAAEQTWLEHRSDGLILKLYQRPWGNNVDLPVGFTHRYSGDFLYMEAPNSYGQMSL